MRAPQTLSQLTLLCVLLLEIGINLNSFGHRPGSRVMPGLLLPVASSVVWLARWDFAVAMAMCALGPLPMLLLGRADGVQILQYFVYMAIAISLSACCARSWPARCSRSSVWNASCASGLYRRPDRPAASQPFSRTGTAAR